MASATRRLRSSLGGLGRRGSLGFSRVSRRVGSGGKSLLFIHCKTSGRLSTISVSRLPSSVKWPGNNTTLCQAMGRIT